MLKKSGLFSIYREEKNKSNIIYVIVGLIAGKYVSIVEGAPSALYPLVSVLYSLFGIAIAVANILYVKKYVIIEMVIL